MTDNPFDQFDAAPQEGNPFDQFDAPSVAASNEAADEAMNGPEGQKLYGQLQNKANKELLDKRGLGPGYAALSSAGNTAFLNLPRNAIAAAKSYSKGTPFDQEYNALKRVDEAAAQQYPKATTAGEVGGVLGQALALPVAAPEALLGRTLAGRAAGGALTGAGLEGVKSYADTKDMPQALEHAGYGALGGALAAPLGEKVVAPLAKKAGQAFGVTVAPKVLSRDELFDKGRQLFNDVDNAGVLFQQPALRRLYNGLSNDLAGKAYGAGDHDAVKRAVNELYKLTVPSMGGPPSYPSFSALERVRQLAQDAVTAPGPDNKRTRMLGRMIKNHIDDFTRNFDHTTDILPGADPQLVKDLIPKARDYWGRASKVETVENAMKSAGWQAGSTYSGGNINNASRQKVRAILDKDLKTPGRWSPDELAQLDKTVMGTGDSNFARAVGNKLGPQGLYGGTEALYGLFGLMHGDPEAALQAAGAMGLGAAGKAYGDRALRNSVNDLTTLISSGGKQANMPGYLSAEAKQKGRNAVIGAKSAFGGEPAQAPVNPGAIAPAAADLARGGVAGATPGAKPADTTPTEPMPKAAAGQMPYGHVVVKDKKTGQMRVFDRTKGEFVGEAASGQ